jgi:hypothetical protein
MSKGSVFTYFLDLEYPIIYNRRHKPRNREPKLKLVYLIMQNTALLTPKVSLADEQVYLLPL